VILDSVVEDPQCPVKFTFASRSIEAHLLSGLRLLQRGSE